MTKANVILAAVTVLVVGVVVAYFGWLAREAGRQNATATSDTVVARLMQRKRAAAMELRDSVRAENHARIRSRALELQRISRASEQFVSAQRYGELGGRFRQQLSELEALADAPDLAPLREKYSEVIATCVACHVEHDIVPLDASDYRLDGAGNR